MAPRSRPLQTSLLPLLLLLSVTLAACDDASGPDEDGSFVAIWQNEPWRGDATISIEDVLDGVDTLHVVGSSRETTASPAVWVHIRVPYTGPGAYDLGSGDARVLHIVGGDVVSAAFDIPAGELGRLVVDEYVPFGSSVGRVTGSVTFGAVATAGDAGASQFSGEFSAVVVDFVRLD